MGVKLAMSKIVVLSKCIDKKKIQIFHLKQTFEAFRVGDSRGNSEVEGQDFLEKFNGHYCFYFHFIGIWNGHEIRQIKIIGGKDKDLFQIHIFYLIAIKFLYLENKTLTGVFIKKRNIA